MPKWISTTVVSTPLGDMVAASRDGALVLLEFLDGRGPVELVAKLGEAADADCAVLETIRSDLSDYFSGRSLDFQTPVELVGTPFQQAAWQALREIPPGETRTYQQQARAIGSPSASRAVGAANGANPLAIIVPCHRVIGAGGKLTGYAGGLDRKRWLLEHEAAHVQCAERLFV